MISAHFLKRENRFVARVNLEGREIPVYVPSTSRLSELFVPGNTVILKDHGEGERKYRYSIEGAQKNNEFIPIDSALPNRLFRESYLKGELDFLDLQGELKREVKVSDRSRLDFKVGETFVEIKGVTLEWGGTAYFPGAPTERGIRHLKELARLSEHGRAMIVYLVLARCKAFSLHPEDLAYREAFERYRDKLEVVALAYEGFPYPTFKGPLPFIL